MLGPVECTIAVTNVAVLRSNMTNDVLESAAYKTISTCPCSNKPFVYGKVRVGHITFVKCTTVSLLLFSKPSDYIKLQFCRPKRP
jgi:hypothetical protein